MAETSTTESSGLDVLAKTGTTAKPGIVNSSILADMQKLYDQKLAERNYFMQDLADASAWWSGGAAGPSAGLAQRAQTRAQQAKDLQDIQAQLSQGKVNLAQLGEANASMGEPQAGISGLPTGGAPAQGGAQPTAGAYTIRGVPVPVQVFKAYQAYIKQGNLAKANEVFDAYTKEETKFLTAPGSYKQEDFFDKDKGVMDRRTPMEVRGGVTPISTARSALAANAEAPPVAPTSAPAMAPTVAPSAPAMAPSAPAMAPTSANMQAPAPTDNRDVYRFENLSNAAKERLNNYAKTELGLQGDAMKRADASELFNKMPMEQRKNAFMKAGETPTVATAPTQMAATTTAPTTASTTSTPRTYSDYLINQAGKKEYSEKSGAAAGEAVGKRQASFESAAVESGKDLQSTNAMLNIIDNNPGAVGYSFKNTGVGATIEGVKLLTGKDIEPFARRLTLSKEDIEAGNKFDTLAQKNSLKFRQDVFKGTGAVSDFETKLAERASGLSRDNSIETNRFFAILAAESYRTVNKLGVEWDKYKKANPNADFAQFEQSDAWKKATAERSARLEKLLPDLVRSELSFGEKAPPKGANSKELEGWKQRYGTPREQ
jgi:hypothetical protein